MVMWLIIHTSNSGVAYLISVKETPVAPFTNMD